MLTHTRALQHSVRLLCMWVHDYSPAVKAFFQNPKNLPFVRTHTRKHDVKDPR
jgi:hypothetical protein